MISVGLATQDHDATDVPMDTTVSPLYQGDPADFVIAMATWTFPYLGAAIQIQASVCGVARVMVAKLVTAALQVIMETPS